MRDPSDPWMDERAAATPVPHIDHRAAATRGMAAIRAEMGWPDPKPASGPESC